MFIFFLLSCGIVVSVFGIRIDASIPRRNFISFTLLSPLTMPTQANAKVTAPTQGEVDDYVESLRQDGGGEAGFVESLKREVFSSDEGYHLGRNFARLDESPDRRFYDEPKFVEHIDKEAVALLTEFNTRIVGQSTDILDVCASHVSHVNVNKSASLRNAVGVGMNEKELSVNPLLTSSIVIDLNENPTLPTPILKGGDRRFDVALLQLSVDYLINPVEVLNSIASNLRPGGTLAISFSDRLFLDKAVGIWSGQDDFTHILTVCGYFAMSETETKKWNMSTLKPYVLSEGKGGKKDPLFAVTCQTKGPIAE